ncbi:MAG: MFS transporter, partial [Gemmataceae bacterium]|nr:MFS transporter [Gemmataceae bacterium]
METRPVIFRALRHRDYRLYFWGQAVSLVGTWLQQAALVWLAYDLTGLSTWTGLVSMATILPTAFLAPFSGWLADLFAKKRIVQLAQTGMLIQAASLAILVWAGQATPERLVLWSLFAGLLQAIDLPTRLSFIKELTGPEDLANAVALNSMQFNLARALGPALAAGLLALVGPACCFALNALSYAAVLAVLWAMRARGETMEGTFARGGIWEGVRFALNHPPVGRLLVLVSLVALAGWPVLSLLPQVAVQRLGWHEAGYGTLLSAVGVGAVLSSLLVARRGFSASPWVYLRTGIVIAALGELVLAHAPVGWCGMAGAFLLGMGLILFIPTAQGVVQMAAVDGVRGRVMALWT